MRKALGKTIWFHAASCKFMEFGAQTFSNLAGKIDLSCLPALGEGILTTGAPMDTILAGFSRIDNS
ncbi:MAG: hypothetical protein V2L15_03760 [Desulfobacteraceae bacterium]|jgi:hypothetical protein|nr:hypothetical protein [Desulfobacteraceae bacterium]